MLRNDRKMQCIVAKWSSFFLSIHLILCCPDCGKLTQLTPLFDWALLQTTEEMSRQRLPSRSAQDLEDVFEILNSSNNLEDPKIALSKRV